MGYWLLKTEPEEWSWNQQTKSGNKGEEWGGVRNFQANKNLKNMKLGDCELAILRLAIDKAGKKLGARALNIPDVQRIISIVENFLKSRITCGFR